MFHPLACSARGRLAYFWGMAKYVTVVEVHALLAGGRSRRAVKTWLDRLEAAGRFPRRVRLSPRCLVWPEAEVRAWLAEREAARGADPQAVA